MVLSHGMCQECWSSLPASSAISSAIPYIVTAVNSLRSPTHTKLPHHYLNSPLSMQTEHIINRRSTDKSLWYLSTAIVFKVYIWPKIKSPSLQHWASKSLMLEPYVCIRWHFGKKVSFLTPLIKKKKKALLLSTEIRTWMTLQRPRKLKAHVRSGLPSKNVVFGVQVVCSAFWLLNHIVTFALARHRAIVISTSYNLGAFCSGV